MPDTAWLDAFDLDPDTVHLNHGSFGAVPRVVSEQQRRVRARGEANPMRFFRVESPQLKEQARGVAAEFLDVEPDAVALVRNVTTSAAVVLSSLAEQGRLGPGDVVLLAASGYHSVRLSVARECARVGATYAVVDFPVDADDEQVVLAYREALDDAAGRVRLVVVDQVTSPTGAVLPVAQVSALAHEAGALCFVDAAHVPGQLPARPRATGADFWTGTWHKWGFAPRGTTALWVTPDERPGVQPLTTSWNHGQPFPLPFDATGTDDYSGWYCLSTALDFWSSAGGPDIAARAEALLDKGAAQVAESLEVGALAGSVPGADDPPATPPRPAPCLRLVPLPPGVADTDPASAALYRALSARGVETQIVAYAGRGWVRLSAALYNGADDYARLAELLPDAVAEVARAQASSS